MAKTVNLTICTGQEAGFKANYTEIIWKGCIIQVQIQRFLFSAVTSERAILITLRVSTQSDLQYLHLSSLSKDVHSKFFISVTLWKILSLFFLLSELG